MKMLRKKNPLRTLQTLRLGLGLCLRLGLDLGSES